MSGQVGISRVKAGDIFFWQLLSLRFCIGFSVSGVDSWFWQPLHDTHPRLSQTPDSSRSAGGWGAGCRVRTLQVGLSRAEAGSFPILYMDFCVCLRARSLAVSVGLWVDRLYAVYSLARVLPRLQIPSPWASWLHDDDTLSAVPIRISVQGYYITVFDAIALAVDPEGTAGNSDRSCSDEKGPFSAKNDSFGPYDTRGGLVSGALWLDCQLRGRLEQARLAGGHGGTRINNNSSKRQS